MRCLAIGAIVVFCSTSAIAEERPTTMSAAELDRVTAGFDSASDFIESLGFNLGSNNNYGFDNKGQNHSGIFNRGNGSTGVDNRGNGHIGAFLRGSGKIGVGDFNFGSIFGGDS